MNQPDKSFRAILVWQYHCHPLADDGFHNHIEYHGGEEIALGYAVVSLKGHPKGGWGVPLAYAVMALAVRQ